MISRIESEREVHQRKCVLKSGVFSEFVQLVRSLFPCVREKDIELYVTLLKVNDYKTVSELCDILRKSRSAIERSLTKLVSAGFVERRTFLNHKSGYVYCYKAKSIHEVKQTLLKALNEYYNKACELIENIDKLLLDMRTGT